MDQERKKSRVNLEKTRQGYEQYRERVATSPTGGKTTVRAVAHLLEDVHLEGRVGRFRFESDEPAARGGTDQGATPLQYFLLGAAF